MRTIWGFDLGVTSVGWSVVRWDGWETADGAGEVLRLGVRVFPETREKEQGGPGDPLNAKRRQARLMRRQTRRRRWRRVHLRRVLVEAGLLPAGATAPPPSLSDPYALRARGLGERLEPEAIGWAIFHLLKRRGFQGSRKVGPQEAAAAATNGQPKRGKSRKTKETREKPPGDAREEDEREARDKGKVLAERMGTLRLSAYLQAPAHLAPDGISRPPFDQARRRDVGQTRQMVREEFDALWAEQSRHHPGFLTDDLRARIETIALAQRPTFFRVRSFGHDDLEPGEPRALKAEWITQRFEMLQLVNALRLEGGNQRGLDAEERARAIRYLETEPAPAFPGLREAIGLGRGERFTHERGEKSPIRGNATEVALRAALGAAWESLPEATRAAIRDAIGQAWHRIEYRPARNGTILEIRDYREIAREREALAKRAQAEWGLDAAQAEALSRIDLPDGTGRHSLKAMQRLLPPLEAGEPYMTAREAVYGRPAEGAPVPRLPGPNPAEVARIEDRFVRERIEALLAGIRNPTVLRTLGELQKVVNTLLRVYGRPDAIRLEFARDLKQSADERRKTDADQRKREKRRQDAREAVATLGKPASGAEGDENVLRWLLWQEQGGRCPFSGDQISCAQALDGSVTEIEHIFPVSRSLDDSQANKVLSFRSENRAKGRRTPCEWLAGDAERWAHLSRKVWPDMVREAKWPEAKMRRCLNPRMEDPDSDLAGFTNRQLVDTAFIARAARDYLGLLYGGGQAGLDAVQPVPGRATALLRRAWGIGLGRLLRGEGEDGPKARDDLRHHAVDALVVALTTPATVAALSRWWQVRETTGTRPAFRPPWPGFREAVRERVEAIVVSHRVQAKLSGPLHEETRLGDTGRREPDGSAIYVKRKPVTALSAAEIVSTAEDGRDAWIADAGVRRAILDHLAAQGIVLKRRARGDDAVSKEKLTAALAQEIRLPLTEAKRRKHGYTATQGPVIRRVRLHLRRKAGVMRVHALKNIHAELGPATNDHIAIYRDGETVRFLVVTKCEAVGRVRRGEPAVLPVHPEGGTLVMALRPGDVVRRETEGGQEFRLIRLIYGTGQMLLAVLSLSRIVERRGWRGPDTLIAEGWCKVSVDPIGRWRPAR